MPNKSNFYTAIERVALQESWSHENIEEFTIHNFFDFERHLNVINVREKHSSITNIWKPDKSLTFPEKKIKIKKLSFAHG